MFSLFRRNARKTQPARRAHASFRPRLEALEDRLTPSGGLLDPTFGSGGIVNLPSTTSYNASAVAVQPDGQVVVVGQITRPKSTRNDEITVQRLNAAGSLDTTFNKSGSATIQTGSSDWSTSVALQPDGKILVGGAAVANNGTYEFLVARLNANGTLDTTFASKGLWVYASTGNAEVEKLAVLTDPAHPSTVTGIVAAAQGYANGTPCFEAIKLTPAGTPDKTFGSGGFAVFANLNGDRITSVATDQLSGEIYLAGTVSVPSANNTGCLAALTPAGALDPAFGGGAGYVLADPTGSHEIYFNDVAVQTLTVNGQPMSRLIVVGQGSVSGAAYGLVSAYTTAGLLDTSFGSGGTFSTLGLGTGQNPSFLSVALEADGSIVVGGFQSNLAADGNYHSEMLVGHLTANGAADTSFGPDGTGFTVLQDGGINSKVEGVAIDPTDGSILACGISDLSTVTSVGAVIRLTAP